MLMPFQERKAVPNILTSKVLSRESTKSGLDSNYLKGSPVTLLGDLGSFTENIKYPRSEIFRLIFKTNLPMHPYPIFFHNIVSFR